MAVVAALAGVFTVLVAGWWTPASAHTEVLRSTPSPGEVLDGPVDSVELTFLDPVQPGVTIVVSGALGEEVPGLGPVEVSDDGRNATTSFPAVTRAGDYVVEYTFTAEDGDTQRETYRFTIQQAAADTDEDESGSNLRGPVVAGVAVLAALVVALVRRTAKE